MSTDVEPSDWVALDPWWTAYAQSGPAVHDDTVRVLERERLARSWDDLDPWWAASAQSESLRPDSTVQVIESERQARWWDDLESWWDVYTDAGHETAAAIADLLEQSTETWKHSASQFDTDPLAADLTGRPRRGPLRPSGEVAWSRWLAQLLRPSAAFVRELFGVPVDGPPSDVIREEQVPRRDGGYRRPDVLVFRDDRAVSIEVKLGDENYRKTAETARLVEREYDGLDWNHTLLLPKRQQGRLDAVVGPALERRPDGQLQVAWDDPGPVRVLYWRDVTAALRSLLRRGEVVDDHWAANAYLFCALAEQRIAGFQSQPVMARLAAPTTVVDAHRPVALADTLEDQLTYLQEMTNA